MLNPIGKLSDPEHPYMRIAAPMVRYSKLPFRELVREYNVDLCYTPMLLADVFKHSKYSQEMEFRTNPKDSPVIVQFAASNAVDFADAVEVVSRYCNGVDLNCGCPQPWAIEECIGSYLMKKPELISDMVRQAKSRTSGVRMDDGSNFPCSIKIRINKDVRETVELARRAESMGVDWITVHGRTQKQKSTEKLNTEAIRIIKQSVGVPVFANGSVFTLEDADRLVSETQTDGVMVARGLLQNPALFSGIDVTPEECIRKYIRLALGYGTNSFIFHHHLQYMLETRLTRAQKNHFNCIGSVASVLDYIEHDLNISL